MRRLLCLFFLLAALLELSVPMDAEAGIVRRWRARRGGGCSACSTCTQCLSPTTAINEVSEAAAPATGDTAAVLLTLHNQARTQRGLAPLTLDLVLCAQAQRAADAQHERGQCGHFTDLRGGSENCALGHVDESDVLSGWMASSGHRSNILGPWTRVGFGRTGNAWAARFAN